MNNELITKIINTNDVNVCPELTYENPLIDRNVAAALARSFLKILITSQQDCKINNNLRNSTLATIRKLCRTEPENHLEFDESFTKLLTKVYMDSLRSSQPNDTNCIDRTLDKFLVRSMKEVDLNSNYECSMNPEVIQALLNLNQNTLYLESISRNVLHWNMSKKNVTLIKKLWTNTSLEPVSTSICDDIAIKMRSEIENILLNVCHRLLTEPNLETEELFSTSPTLMDLIKKSSISPECFQICSRILNYLFIHTNHNIEIQVFISKFIKNVINNSSNSISTLYPAHLSFIIVLLNIDLDTLPNKIKVKYVERTLVHLKKLQAESDGDLVLLLSHFPQWFQIYCHSIKLKQNE